MACVIKAAFGSRPRSIIAGETLGINDTIDTIAAIATPPGKGGVGIIRISGPRAADIATTILGKLPKPRYAKYQEFSDHQGQTIDKGIALYFPGPHSFTGEHIVELQGHGGPVILDILLKHILSLGARLAKPGEFSERAFLNDKIDLTQAEAIADLIAATSEQAARSAMRSMEGAFSKKITALSEQITTLRIYIEAAIDFPEEEIDFLSDNKLSNNLIDLSNALTDTIDSAQQGAILRDGIKIVLAGQPNSGKSTLLNCLSGRDSAIVTDIPGTTRDVLREHIHLDGIPLHIIDTAGLRESNDRVEQEGIKRTHQEIDGADCILLITDMLSTAATQKNILDKLPTHIPTIIVFNKIDLLQQQPSITQDNGYTSISISAKTGLGIELLQQQLREVIGYNSNSEGVFIARRRHLDALQRAQNFLETGRKQLQQHRAGELLADDLWHAQQALGEITGKISSDELLGHIFSSFCIGK